MLNLSILDVKFLIKLVKKHSTAFGPLLRVLLILSLGRASPIIFVMSNRALKVGNLSFSIIYVLDCGLFLFVLLSTNHLRKRLV